MKRKKKLFGFAGNLKLRGNWELLPEPKEEKLHQTALRILSEIVVMVENEREMFNAWAERTKKPKLNSPATHRSKVNEDGDQTRQASLSDLKR